MEPQQHRRLGKLSAAVIAALRERGPLSEPEIHQAVGSSTIRSTINNLVSTNRIFHAGEKLYRNLRANSERMVATYSADPASNKLRESGLPCRALWRLLQDGKVTSGQLFLFIVRMDRRVGRAVPAFFYLPPEDYMEVMEHVDMWKVLRDARFNEKLLQLLECRAALTPDNAEAK